MKINNVEIKDTFAEGFSLYGSRVLITAKTLELARAAVVKVTGFATSTISCDCEAGIDSIIPESKTPDGRPGISVIFCVQGKKKMDDVLLNRIGQCILTAPTTACYDWFPEDIVSEKTFEVKTGFKLKFFGDGYEEKEIINFNGKEITTWKVPVMDGWFVIQSTIKVTKIAGGGNLLMFADTLDNALNAIKKAVEKMNEVDGIVTPFPYGVARSPSKMGSKKYAKFLSASTNDPESPVLKDKIENSRVPNGANAGYEFVINGFDKARVEKAMKIAIETMVQEPGVIEITAANYDGKLGKIFYNLKEIMGL